jgi:hypothetical protein
VEQRSTFVTVVAWIFIALSGFMLLQAAIMSVVSLDKFFPPAAPGQPGPAVLQGFIHVLYLIMAIIAAWVLLSAIGLLLRKNWARISFIVMMILGIGWNSLYILMGVLGAVLMHGASPDPKTPAAVQAMMPAIFGAMAVMGIAFVVLFGWILYQLLSDRIKKEFLPSAPQS